MGQRVATDIVGLWLRRSRVRAPSVTLVNYPQTAEKWETLVRCGYVFYNWV